MKQPPRPVSFRVLFLLALITTYLASYEQPLTPIPHTLLWRITGKGLRKPSYLYGTMHLNDKRLFFFGDSLYHAIESSEGLAIEVNPDEMAAYFVNKMFDQMESGKKLEDVVGKEYIEHHREALAKKFHKPADKISATDVFKEKNKWMNDVLQKGEMSTFMDAYLYNIARRQGKWMGGIEDMGDQAGLMEGLIDQSDINYLLKSDDGGVASEKSTVEKMIRLYTAQDLEGVQAMTNEGSTPEQKDMLLLHRNVKMARRMDSLSAIRSMVFAVGCAHLPGDSGVIDLLHRRGFTVEPVYSSKKLSSDDYTFKEIHLPWKVVKDEDSTYTAEMPANPATIHIYGLIEMKFLMDIFNMSGFGTMSVINPGRSRSKDELFKATAEAMFHGKVPPGKSLVKNGYPGIEYIRYDSAGNIRVQLFADSNRVYVALMFAVKKEPLLSPDADKFFRSYTITGVSPAAGLSTTEGMERFVDSMTGVSFLSPVHMTYNDKMSRSEDKSWNMTCFTGVDRKTGALVMLMCKSLTPGLHISDLPGTYAGMENVFTTQYSDLQKDSIFLDSNKVMLYNGQNTGRPEIFISAATVIREGKQTTLMVISDSSKRSSPALTEVIRSFRLIPHAAVHWDKYEEPDHLFSFYGPSPVITHMYEGNRRWISFDSTTATSYLIIPDTLGKYVWYPSDSAFWNATLSDTAGVDLMEIKDVTNGPVAGKEYLVRSKTNSTACYRSRLLLNGDKLYRLYSFGEPRLMKSPEVDRFFNDFRFDAVAPKTITQSKASLLLRDLGSRDSATREGANEAYRNAPFGKEDAGLLRDALFKTYSLSDDSSGLTVNYKIAETLSGLNDPATVDFVRVAYPGLVKEKEVLRNVGLSLLMGQHTSHSYGVLAELMSQGPTAERLDHGEGVTLTDSLPLTSALYPSLLPWAKDTLHASLVAAVTVALVDSGFLSKEAMASSGGTFIEAARAVLPGLRVNKDYEDYRITSLTELIGRLHTPAANAVLKDYQPVKNDYLLWKVVTHLLEARQQVSNAALHRLAEDPEYRILIYDTLKSRNKSALFPKEYLTQSAFARAAVLDAQEEQDDDELADSTIFVGKRTASYRGKAYAFYLYKLAYKVDDEYKYYLGVAGGYDPAGVGLKPKMELSGIYKGEEFDKVRLGALLKAYLKGLEE